MGKEGAEPQQQACAGCGNDVAVYGTCPWCALDLIEVQPAWA
jgi:hypothetical protein